MKYKVGDRVRVKSLEWYNANKDTNNRFVKAMTQYCGLVTTVKTVMTRSYILDGTRSYCFSDEMLEDPENMTIEIPAGYEVDKIESGKIILKRQEVTTYSTLQKVSGFTTDNKFLSAKEAKSAAAMAQISQLMPYYGGAITDEEWYNEDMSKYCIERKGNHIERAIKYYSYNFLAFHTREQRERFTSYPDNVQLVKDYLMID